MSQPIFKDGLGYEGKVTLTLKSNGYTIKSSTYKNRGTTNLFKFLGHCLTNEYDKAKNFLPVQISLLMNNSEGLEHSNAAAADMLDQRSSYIPLAQQPVLISDSNNAQVSVIYSFEVSKAAISGVFNQIALYRANPDGPADFSAYYFLAERQNPANWSATTVLLIEWELILSNKNVAADPTQEEETK